MRLPGLGDVSVRWSRALPGEASSVTVTVDATGRCHASFVVDVPDAPLPPTGREVGIDLGLTHFAVLSDGRKVDNPRIARKAAAKLRRAQQELARRQKGSANRRKAVRNHDRDRNAAINILAAGRAESSETPVELVSAGTPVPQPAVKQEPAGSTA